MAALDPMSGGGARVGGPDLQAVAGAEQEKAAKAAGPIVREASQLGAADVTMSREVLIKMRGAREVIVSDRDAEVARLEKALGNSILRPLAEFFARLFGSFKRLDLANQQIASLDQAIAKVGTGDAMEGPLKQLGGAGTPEVLSVMVRDMGLGATKALLACLPQDQRTTIMQEGRKYAQELADKRAVLDEQYANAIQDGNQEEMPSLERQMDDIDRKLRRCGVLGYAEGSDPASLGLQAAIKLAQPLISEDNPILRALS